MSEQFEALEWGRMFLGDKDVLFYLEIVMRTVIIYVYTFVLLRLFGRRTKASMSIMDVIVIVALGSAVGDVAFYPEVPILHCLLVVTLIVGINKGLVELSQKSHKIRDFIEGDATVVVRDGVIQMEALSSTSVGRAALLELIREKSVCNLSQIALAVLEPSCKLSIYQSDGNVSGLSILPPDPVEDSLKDLVDGKSGVCVSCGVERIASDNRCETDGCDESQTAPSVQPKFSM